MVKYEANAADVLVDWMIGEREYLAYLTSRQASFLNSIKVGQTEAFKAWCDNLANHLATLDTSDVPFPPTYWAEERKWPMNLMQSYKDFLATVTDNQVGLMAKFIVPVEEIPDNLEPYVESLENQTLYGPSYLQGAPSDDQSTWYRDLTFYEKQVLQTALWDRINPTPKGLIDRCTVLLKRTGERVAGINDLRAALDAAAKSLDEQKVAFGVTRKGITYKVFNPRKWRVGYTPTQPEALHYISTARAAEMWNTLSLAQRRPFKALAFGQRLVEWARAPPPPPTDTAALLPNTLNKAYLRFLKEYYDYWCRTNQALPYPIENVFKTFYPNKEVAPNLFLLVDCDPYRTPDLVEMMNEEGGAFKSATCPHLDDQTVYVLPYGLGVQHWERYTSQETSDLVAKEKPLVVAHDFRIRELKTQTYVWSQDPREWEYTGEWPQVTKYLGNWADMRIIGWLPWTQAIEVEIWRGNEDKLIEVFWGRQYLGLLETKGQAEQPLYALARFVVHYRNYHDFNVEILWWRGLKMPDMIPIVFEDWGYIEPPEMALVFTETWETGIEEPPEMELVFTELWSEMMNLIHVFTEEWSYDPTGPIPLTKSYGDDWNYIEPPDMQEVVVEHWSA